MRSFYVNFVLLSIFFISVCVIVDCSTCKQKNHQNNANDVNRTKSFKNLSGNPLEEAVIDEIAQQSKINFRIDLRHLGISSITKNMLKNISSIQSIDFQSNEITEIENGSFTMNGKLDKIDLMENHLTKITKHIFSGNFHELQEINLSFNAISAIESGSFDRLVNLVSIDISSNCITHLHSDLFKKCSDLRQVFLSSNRIIKIGSHLFNIKTELNILDLSFNNLEMIPKFKIKSIKHLDMSHNNITELDLNHESSHERKKLANVEELSVAYNAITKCVKISEMRNDIVRLDLSHNQINDMNDFPILLNMEVLQLSHNNLSSLSVYKFRERFPSLKALNISENKIDCEEYHVLHNSYSRLAISVDTHFAYQCINISGSINNEMEVMNTLQSNSHEILRQLKLNRTFLIVLTSIFAVLIIIPITFLLYYYRRYDTVKYMKGENLIEQIEL
ncbi:unnamed protein product [Chironomus riparius]|uniref:Uncharacterized protein n=1 Tax=Chironomus riparius TaxID=315576 RepID=A0A9N9RV65_9DIPT|nr:unnamed protein product [Chironomus riparius]